MWRVTSRGLKTSVEQLTFSRVATNSTPLVNDLEGFAEGLLSGVFAGHAFVCFGGMAGCRAAIATDVGLNIMCRRPFADGRCRGARPALLASVHGVELS